MNLGLAQIFFYGAAQTTVKRTLPGFFGQNIFGFATPDGDFFATVGGGKNPFGRTVKNCRGCSHQINSMIELLLCQLPTSANYGWLVIFCQLIPCVPA
jgi:hypothetical protein